MKKLSAFIIPFYFNIKNIVDFLFAGCQEDGSALESLKKGVAEMVGTGIIVFLGCLGCVGSMGNVPSQVQICLSFGFAVITAITVSILFSKFHSEVAKTF